MSTKNMITDLRVQKRTIKIQLKVVGSEFNLDEDLDEIVEDLMVVLAQRKSTASGLVKVEVYLK